jgi:hypothetical protein
MALTARQIETAKPQYKPYKMADGGGLYLYVAPTGLRSWRANHQQDGKQKTRPYGRYPNMTLSQARIAHGMPTGYPSFIHIPTGPHQSQVNIELKHGYFLRRLV